MKVKLIKSIVWGVVGLIVALILAAVAIHFYYEREALCGFNDGCSSSR